MMTNTFVSKIRSFFQERQRWIVAGLLAAILLLGTFLRFYHLGQSGMNEYYAATVKSMLVSWKNFFFVAFEPGGSVSVDKPPLGFWIEAVSAYFLGVNGFALALPNAIAGVLSIFVVYQLIRRPFGQWIGLVAASALAVMPVAIATERNNTIDGMLMFVLLLAAWAFLQSVYTGKARWLFLGAFIVGLGFNIKMLQAYMPLPAFYAVYFFGAKQSWIKKILHLAAATVLLLIVSFSWAVAVDLTPAADRPYVDSTSGDRVMELIFGHNGIERLTRLGPSSNGGQTPPSVLRNSSSLPQPPNGQNFSQGNPPQLPNGQALMPSSGNDGQFGPMNNAGGPGGSMDFGSAGTLRLFTQPLVGEASWLLPFALGGLIVLVIALWKGPFGERQASVIMWAGWLLPEAIYFTYSQGLMHAYYLIMLGAPIAALAAMTLWALWQIIQKRWFIGWTLAILLIGGTLAFETYTLLGKTSIDIRALELAGILFSVGLVLALMSRFRVRFAATALSLLLAALLVAPTVWSGLTAFNSFAGGLPAAGLAGGTGAPDGTARVRADGGDGLLMMPSNADGNNIMARPIDGGPGNRVDQNLLSYLLANTEPGTYLVATGSANSAAPLILETGRPVLTLGGFLNQYDEVSVDQLASLVKNGQLRFVLGEALDRHQAIAQWVRGNCTLFNRADYSGDSASNMILYDCGG
jgi:4-amino-4-deoxy-L-arabinose transferase-like glycosyltransferase